MPSPDTNKEGLLARIDKEMQEAAVDPVVYLEYLIKIQREGQEIRPSHLKHVIRLVQAKS